MRVVITGATGFLGNSLVPALQDQGIFVHAIARRSSPILLRADAHDLIAISHDTDWAPILKNADAVVHLADGLNRFEGVTRQTSPSETTSQLDISLNLAETALACGVDKFVHVSSIKAVVGEGAREPVTERTPAKPTQLYGRLKLELEHRLLELFGSDPERLLILRVPIVYGPGCKGNFARLIRLADSPWPLPFAKLSSKRSMVSVTNAAGAIVCALTSGIPPERTYIIDDGAALAISEVVSAIREELGRPVRLMFLPKVMWHAAEHLPGVGPLARRFSQSLVTESGEFREVFSWHPPQSVKEAIKETVQAYKDSSS